MTTHPRAARPAGARSDVKDEPDVGQVQLLWTGGWDSTYRLLELLLIHRRPVQPIYVVSPERRSTMQELAAMLQIRDGVLPRLSDPSLLARTQMVVAEDFAPRPDLVQLRWAIRRGGAKVGTQYVLLAAIADELGWDGVELCMQAHDEGPTPLHRMVFADDRGTLTDAPEARLFQRWSFPVLHVTKSAMAETARNHGFMDLLSLRWYCHDPLGGRPCGFCHPCTLAYPAGPAFVHPALVRNRNRLRRRAALAARLRGRLPMGLRESLPDPSPAALDDKWWADRDPADPGL